MIQAFLSGYMYKSAAPSGVVVQKVRKRDYAAEYARYHGTPEQIARRAGRNKARRIAVNKGMAVPGDSMDVDHVDGDPLNNADSNIRMMGMTENRSRKHNTEKLKKQLAEADKRSISIPKGLPVLKLREYLNNKLAKTT